MDRTFREIAAKRLAPGDLFVKHGAREDAEQHEWAWTVLRHDFSDGGGSVSDGGGSVSCAGS